MYVFLLLAVVAIPRALVLNRRLQKYACALRDHAPKHSAQKVPIDIVVGLMMIGWLGFAAVATACIYLFARAIGA